MSNYPHTLHSVFTEHTWKHTLPLCHIEATLTFIRDTQRYVDDIWVVAVCVYYLHSGALSICDGRHACFNILGTIFCILGRYTIVG